MGSLVLLPSRALSLDLAADKGVCSRFSQESERMGDKAGAGRQGGDCGGSRDRVWDKGTGHWGKSAGDTSWCRTTGTGHTAAPIILLLPHPQAEAVVLEGIVYYGRCTWNCRSIVRGGLEPEDSSQEQVVKEPFSLSRIFVFLLRA